MARRSCGRRMWPSAVRSARPRPQFAHGTRDTVARLAAIPEDVLKRAGEILIDLENGDQHQRVISTDLTREPAQLELFTPIHDPIREKLNSLALEHMTPIQALNVLYELKHDSQRESG